MSNTLDELFDVTDTRNFSEKISHSRNRPKDWFWGLTHNERLAADPNAYRADATVCHWCRNKFMARQMRYPVMTNVDLRGWDLASVCVWTALKSRTTRKPGGEGDTSESVVAAAYQC